MILTVAGPGASAKNGFPLVSFATCGPIGRITKYVLRVMGTQGGSGVIEGSVGGGGEVRDQRQGVK